MPDWSQVYQTVSNGVVRLDVTYCASGGVATGFLIAPNLVATVAHAVENVVYIQVTDPKLGRAVLGTVIGLDHEHDLALVQLSAPLAGHIFRLSHTLPAIGTEIAAIGFQLGRSMQQTVGHITDIHDRRFVSGDGWQATLSNMVLTDADVNPGNSGGPWLTRDGQVVALDESGPPFDGNVPAQGNNGGVPASDAVVEMTSWQRLPQPPTPSTCDFDPTDSQTAASLTLYQYLYDISETDYASAYAQLDPATYPLSGVDKFTTSVLGSDDRVAGTTEADGHFFDVVDESATATEVTMDVTFRSTQSAALGPDGETCTDWQLRYRFRPVNGLWLIHSSVPTPGTAGHAACPVTDPTSSTSSPGGTKTPTPSATP